ncbi:unnamed protein product, partial [Mycena citricolor]
ESIDGIWLAIIRRHFRKNLARSALPLTIHKDSLAQILGDVNPRKTQCLFIGNVPLILAVASRSRTLHRTRVRGRCAVNRNMSGFNHSPSALMHADAHVVVRPRIPIGAIEDTQNGVVEFLDSRHGGEILDNVGGLVMKRGEFDIGRITE